MRPDVFGGPRGCAAVKVATPPAAPGPLPPPEVRGSRVSVAPPEASARVRPRSLGRAAAAGARARGPEAPSDLGRVGGRRVAPAAGLSAEAGRGQRGGRAGGAPGVAGPRGAAAAQGTRSARSRGARGGAAGAAGRAGAGAGAGAGAARERGAPAGGPWRPRGSPLGAAPAGRCAVEPPGLAAAPGRRSRWARSGSQPVSASFPRGPGRPALSLHDQRPHLRRSPWLGDVCP